jgi:hypothetical protein
MPQRIADLMFFFHDLIVYILIMFYKVGGLKLTAVQAMLVQRLSICEGMSIANCQLGTNA